MSSSRPLELPESDSNERAGIPAAGLVRRDWKIAAALFVMTLGCYAFTFSGGGWGPNATLALVRSIVEYRSLSIDHFSTMTGDVSRSAGRTYSNKAPGIAFLAAPFYAALVSAERLARLDIDSFKVATFNGYACTVAICGIPGAAIPAVLFLYGRARRIASAPWLVAVALAVALGTPLFGYSTSLYLHVPSAALLLIAWVLASLRRAPFVSGLAGGTAAMTNYLCFPPLVLVVVLYAVSRRTRLAHVLRFVSGTVLPISLLAAYQFIAFGSPFATSIDKLDPLFVTRGAALGVLTLPSARALWGVTFSPYRGLFYASPVLLLAVVGAARMWRRRMKVEAATVAGIVLFFLFVNSCFNGWWGGYTVSARYLVPIVPFLGVWMLYASRAGATILAALAIPSIATQTVIALVDIHPPDDMRRPITEYIVPQFITGVTPYETPRLRHSGGKRVGHVAVNPLPVAKCCGSVWSSFNLGEPFLGQGSLASTLPLLVWALGGTLAVFRMARTEDVQVPSDP